MLNNKIFIEQEPQTGDFLMRMPADALPALYEMLLAAPLTSRRWFFQVKAHLEDRYNAPLAKAGLVKTKAQAPAAAAVSAASPAEEKKVVVEREQSGACSSYAECEQARRSSGKGGRPC